MKDLVKNLGLIFGMVLLSVSAMAVTIDPPTIDKVESEVNIKVSPGDAVCRVVVAECCNDFDEYHAKKINALTVLRTACDGSYKITKAGDYKFVDFIDYEHNKVARLVLNDNKKIIMLLTHDFKILK